MKMNPIETAAGDAVLVGDPRRAFALAQELTVQPRMSHQARGLWGYTGITVEGTPLTVQSTGSGGPGAVAVIGDLAEQGIERVLRLGTCLAIDPGLELGVAILVERALSFDGASRALGAGDATLPDPDLLRRLDGLGRRATISSHDLVARYEAVAGERVERPGGEAAGAGPAIARDLQTAASFAMCERLEIPAAALLIVAEDGSGGRLGEDELWNRFRTTGKAALGRLNS